MRGLRRVRGHSSFRRLSRPWLLPILRSSTTPAPATIDNKWFYTYTRYDSFWRVQDVHHYWWLAKGGAGSAFHYDAARRRAVQLEFDSMAGGAPEHYTKKRLYTLGSTVEVDYINQTTTGAGMDWKLDTVRVYVPGPAGNLGAMEFNPTAPPSRAETARVYHTDHLGSIETITDFGSSTVALDKAGRASRYSYDPWGQRRNTQTWSGPPPPDSQGGKDDITPRGFTGHEMLDDLGLVHMNGRIYDPQLGRFLSADVLVQDESHLQAFNRFSYVMNSPLAHFDPSGFLTVVVHGTFSSPGARWVQPMVNELSANGFKNVIVFDWSGADGEAGGPSGEASNAHQPRVNAGRRLNAQISEWKAANDPDDVEPVNIIAHSHGGNVATVATHSGLQIDTLVTLGRPHVSDEQTVRHGGNRKTNTIYPYAPAQGAVTTWVNVWDQNDDVQTYWAGHQDGRNFNVGGHTPDPAEVPAETSLINIEIRSNLSQGLFTTGRAAHSNLTSTENIALFVEFLRPDQIAPSQPPPEVVNLP